MRDAKGKLIINDKEGRRIGYLLQCVQNYIRSHYNKAPKNDPTNHVMLFKDVSYLKKYIMGIEICETIETLGVETELSHERELRIAAEARAQQLEARAMELEQILLDASKLVRTRLCDHCEDHRTEGNCPQDEVDECWEYQLFKRIDDIL